MGQTLVLKQREVVHLRGWDFGPLTLELQEYYQELLQSCFGISDEKRYKALMSIQHDTAMIEMTKFVSKFIFDQVQNHAIHPNLRNMTILMKIVEHLIRNENVVKEVKHCLHEILPSVMTCIVCCTLSAAPQIEDHWKLRMTASELLLYICDNFGSPVNRIRERAIKVLVTAIQDETKDLSTLYGALFGLKTLGFEAIQPHKAYIETSVKQRVEKYTIPGFVDKHRSTALRIKDLISQISTMEATVASIPKAKARAVNKDVPTTESRSVFKTFGVHQPKRTPKKKAPPKQPVVSVIDVDSSPLPSPMIVDDSPTDKPSSKPAPIPRMSPLAPKDQIPSSSVPEPVVVAPVSSSAAQTTTSSLHVTPRTQNAPKKTPELVTPAALFHTYHVRACPRPRSQSASSKTTAATAPFRRPSSAKPAPIKRKLPAGTDTGKSDSPVVGQEKPSTQIPSMTQEVPRKSPSFITITCPSTTAGPQYIFVPKVEFNPESTSDSSMAAENQEQSPGLQYTVTKESENCEPETVEVDSGEAACQNPMDVDG